MKKTLRPIVFLSAALLAILAGCASSPVTQADSPSRPNQPMFVDPMVDTKSQTGALAESWFICANVHDGDREYGILIHFMKIPFSSTTTIAITDVTDGRYYLDDRKGGSIRDTADGFDIETSNIEWSSRNMSMRVKGTMKSGDGEFDFELMPAGPALAYNGTGYFPLVDNDTPTWEYAHPQMETKGTLTIRGEKRTISGRGWFDRQWFKSAKVSPGNGAHWTWLAIKLSNGDILAIWDTVGKRERCWANILHPDGTLTIADATPLSQTQNDFWVSGKSKVRWPAAWIVGIPGTGTKLDVRCTSKDQETFSGFPRIESVIRVEGVHQGQSVAGTGFAEIVGDPEVKK